MFRVGLLAAVVGAAQGAWLKEEGIGSRFSNTTEMQIKRLLGTVVGPEAMVLPPKLEMALAGDLPESFDSRSHPDWAACKEVISHVRDQSDCGSCWAMGSTEALNDRRCIAHGETEFLSPTHTLSCCSGLSCGLSQGCNGGQPAGAWRFFTRSGVVTGGDFGDVKTCVPYAFEACAHHVDSDTLPGCDDVCPGKSECATPSCPKACTNEEYGLDFKEDLHLARTAYSLKGEEAIMADIYQHGPVTGAFTVYDDFPTYKSGVYQKTRGARPLGGHAIEIVGWGVEDGLKYWLVKNSWNSTWGDGGFFKILRGENECGIEDAISAGEV